MIIPIFTQIIYSEIDPSFISASIISIIFGILFFLSNLNHDKKLNLHQAFLLTALSWVSIAIFGSLPFIFSSLDLTITDGRITSISIQNVAFNGYPDLNINSTTGYGAVLRPIMRIVPPQQKEIVQVIDCVR